MDVVSSKEMVAREEEAFHSGITVACLMEAAGTALGRRITTLYPRTQKFLVLVGKGNNGGDGLVVARQLAATGHLVTVLLAAPDADLGEMPRAMLKKLRTTFSQPEIIPWCEDFVFPANDVIVIDALLGLQARGTLRGVAAEMVAKLNEARVRNFFRTVALDLPSGLAAFEEGETPTGRDSAVVADVTLAVGFAKEVLCREELSAWVGRLEVIAWGGENRKAGRQVLVAPELASLLPRRSALSHKNTFGRVVIVAGSSGFTGAPVLCAQAAQAMGAGLLSVVTRTGAHAVVAAKAPPEVMVSSWPPGETPKVIQEASAIVIGPGLGSDAEVGNMLRTVLEVGCPVVIDADGLTALAQNLNLLRDAKGPVLLTPHVGEMGRLVGHKFSPAEREKVARAFTNYYEVTLLLKGTRTLITASGQPFFINTTGNPGLSTGGSGDTLSGILGALLAQGLCPLNAARLGAWLHGHAADLVLAERGCEEGLTPTMLSATLGEALVCLRAEAIEPKGLLEQARKLEMRP